MNNKQNTVKYDTCYDCGGDMTASFNQPVELTIMHDNDIKEVYVSCDDCGGRAGYRDYKVELHL